MPRGVYKRTGNYKKRSDRLLREVRECLGGCGLEKEVKINSKWERCRSCYEKTMIGGTILHKLDCECSPCRAKRGELSGINNPMFGKTTSMCQKLKAREAQLGKSKSKESVQKSVITKKKNGSYEGRWTGPKNPNWTGGLNLPYGPEFDRDLKEIVRKRDNYICQNCGMTEEEHLIVFGIILSVHHIDYDKLNNILSNLISLCRQCHLRTNHNRTYWKELLVRKMILKLTVEERRTS
jgi:HNH endonuclease